MSHDLPGRTAAGFFMVWEIFRIFESAKRISQDVKRYSISCHFVGKKVYILEWHETVKNAILKVLCSCRTENEIFNIVNYILSHKTAERMKV